MPSITHPRFPYASRPPHTPHTPRAQTPSNPLSELIHSEKTYLDTLKIIDSHIAPLWMKQTVSAAPDFSEQLKNANGVYRANKRFYSCLLKVAGHPSALKELGDVLMQWVQDMEQPYARYLERLIHHINTRDDILDTASIRQRLNTVSLNLSRRITLEDLFSAPVNRLDYYKGLYHRLLQSTKPGRADHDLLIIANQRIDRLIQIAANPHHSDDTAVDNDHDGDDDELFALYDDYATEEPEEQEKARAGRKAFRDTIMDFYGSRNRENDVSPTTHDNDNEAVMDEDGQDLANITPRSVKMLSRIPDIHVANVMIHPSPLSPPPPHVDESSAQSASHEDPMQQSSTEEQSAESTPVQMTYIQPAVLKATLIRHDVDDNVTNDDNDDDDDIPLIPQQPPAVSSNIDNNNNQRSSSKAPSIERHNNQGGQQQHAVMQTMESLRSALTASLDSFTDSTHSLQSSYSAPRSSSSTAATETVPNTYIEEKPSPSSNTPRSLPLAESPSSNEYQQRTSYSKSNMQSTTAPVDHQQRQGSMQLMMNSSSDSIAMQSSISNFGGGQRDPQERQSHGNQLQTLESPPESPGIYANATRQVLYTHGCCHVFHWKDQTWYAAESPCSVLVRMTNSNRYCISLQLLSTGELYLNAWVVPNMGVQLMAQSDVSLSVYVGMQLENYLVHFDRRPDAVELENVMQYAQRETTRMMDPVYEQQQQAAHGFTATSLADPEEGQREAIEEGPQTLTPLMQCKCKLFAQQEVSSWNSIGNVELRLCQQQPSQKMHIEMENNKGKLASAVVLSRNVEKKAPKRITFQLITDNSSMVYMINFKDERTTNKVFDFIKTQNAQNGW